MCNTINKRTKEKRETDTGLGIWDETWNVILSMHCDLYDWSQTPIAFLRNFNWKASNDLVNR